jgi:hypothetical protein
MHNKRNMPQNKKNKYAGGGVSRLADAASQFNVGGNFLQGLLQRTGEDPGLLDKLRRRAGLGGSGFGNPVVRQAAQADKAKAAKRAAKGGGLMKNKGKKKYI